MSETRMLSPAELPDTSLDELPPALRVGIGAVSALGLALEEIATTEPGEGAGSIGAWHEIVRRATGSLEGGIVMAEKGLRLLGGDELEGGRVLLDVLELMRLVVKAPTALLATWERDDAQLDAA